MLDFMKPSYQEVRRGKGVYEIYPKFLIRSSSDLMIRGSDFYAVWNEDENLWSTKEEVALQLIDRELDSFKIQFEKERPDAKAVRVLYMWDGDTKMIDKWHRYVKQQCRDNFHPLDENLIFSNTETRKEDYASKKLPYPLERCDIPAWDKLISTLYEPAERHKLEWAIGAIVNGDSKHIQKFIVMYGAPKTGKSTILNIIQDLFDGYYSVFDSKALGSATNVFALEAFKSNPLVAIQHDGDLSKIEDNTRLNSLVSHEQMLVNEKFKSAYSVQFNSFLIMGTNKPVRITDSKSGILRRLIDVSPSGDRIKREEYDKLMSKIKFELGGIAQHCLDVYLSDPKYYEDYVPTKMIGASNDFYNFILDSYDKFKAEDATTLTIAWERYNKYCDTARVPFRYKQMAFKEELKSYFREFETRGYMPGETTRAWNVYKGFAADKFIDVVLSPDTEKPKEETKPEFELKCQTSLFDIFCKDWPAQYANEKGTPYKSWDNVTTTLKDLDTTKEHFLLFPEKYWNYIVIDFDLKDSEGNKSFALNAEEASKWPPTYAELSRGGQGIHLHYIYTGDVNKLSRIYDNDIEVKIFTGKSSLRRKLSWCNDLPIATISSGLPLREEKKVVNFEGLKNERALRTIIKRSLLKEYPPHATVTSVEFIKKVLDDAYASEMVYDVSDMRPAITTFAGRSTHHALDCMSMVAKMKFKSEEAHVNFDEYESDILVFYDVEVFENLFVVVFMADGKNPVKLINPSARDIERLIKLKLVGFNNASYDDIILYARLLGETNAQLYNRSKKLTNKDKSVQKDGKIAAARGLSYTDVFDFASKKQSLKKWEIELGIDHQELGIPWDQPVPEELWEKVADYCANDVKATAALFHHLKEDWKARQILADLAGGTVNESTNTLTTKIVFGNERYPQLVYTDLATGKQSIGR